MNKIYKLVWSKTRNMYVAVSELAKRRSKSPKTGIVGRTVTAGILAAIISCGAVFPGNVEAYTYDGQSATVSEIATDNADTIVTNSSNVTVNGNVTLPKSGTSYSYNSNSISLNFNLNGAYSKQDAVNKLMALGNSLNLADPQGYGDGWASAADSSLGSVYYHDYYGNNNSTGKPFAVHEGQTISVVDTPISFRNHDIVTGNYCVNSKWLGGGDGDAEDYLLVVQMDTTTGEVAIGIDHYLITDNGGHWDDWVIDESEFTKTSIISTPNLSVTSSSALAAKTKGSSVSSPRKFNTLNF